MHYSNNFERDFNFYNDNKEKFTFCGEEVLSFPYDKNGLSAKDVFYKFDSTGKLLPTKEPELARLLLQCKKAINFQIKQWVEGYDDCLIGREEYLNEFIGEYPEWINKSFINQRFKYYKNKIRNSY